MDERTKELIANRHLDRCALPAVPDLPRRPGARVGDWRGGTEIGDRSRAYGRERRFGRHEEARALGPCHAERQGWATLLLAMFASASASAGPSCWASR